MSDQKLYVRYNDIHNLIQSKAYALRSFNPDIILAIGGGGLLPGRIVRKFLKKPLITCTLKLYNDTTNTVNSEVAKLQWLDPIAEQAIKDKRVLIVDEVDDTRSTLDFCVKELNKHPIKDLGIFVVHNKIKDKKGKFSGEIPYFVGEDIPDLWVVFPWEAEDIEEHDILASKQFMVDS